MATRKSSKKPDLTAETIARIRADVARWRHGLWAEEVAYGPACICGVRIRKGFCHVHPGEEGRNDDE